MKTIITSILLFFSVYGFASGEINILGLWEDKDNDRNIMEFNSNHDYRIGMKFSSWFNSGKWELTENILTMIQYNTEYESFDVPIVEEYYVFINNENHLSLRHIKTGYISLWQLIN